MYLQHKNNHKTFNLGMKKPMIQSLIQWKMLKLVILAFIYKFVTLKGKTGH